MEGRPSRSARRLGTALGLALALLSTAVPVARAAATKLRVPYTTFTLPNGLQVILHEDHSLPIVSVNTWYRVGSGDEKPGRTGFAHLFEHLMFMGSEHVPTGDFDRLLEAAGADNNGSTTADRTNYFEDGPANALPLMLYLDSDRMGYLVSQMTPENVDLQRGVVQNERRQSYENRPYGLADENILRRLYPAGHPYSWPVIGSMADLSAASLEDVKGFFRSYYTPNNAVLSIAGDITPAEARRLVERWFGAVPRGPEVKRPAPAPFALAADVPGTLEDRVQVPRLYDSWHTQKAFAPDDAALSAAAQVLAGGKASRLYQRLVYQLEIASDVYAYQDGGRLDGEFRVVATARPGHGLDELQQVVTEEIARLAAQGPTPRELERVVNGVETQALDNMQQVGGFGGIADQLNQYAYFAGTPDYFEQDLDRFRKLTPADLQRVVRQYLADAHKVVLSVVPQGKTELAVSEGRQP
jgi:zinc protease